MLARQREWKEQPDGCAEIEIVEELEQRIFEKSELSLPAIVGPKIFR